MKLPMGSSRQWVGLVACACLTGSTLAHDLDNAGKPVCLEGNIMVADSGLSPLNPGPGRVLEVNLTTSQLGVAFEKPEVLPAPWRPTGVLSGGVNGHTFINSAAWHRVSEFHRNGVHIRSVEPITSPGPAAGPGAMPRLLGSQFMPNGNIALSVCDFNNAKNSRILVLDPDTLKEIDEYSAPEDPRWTCMAGIIFAEDGMYVSMFHGAAVFVIDWKSGAKNINQSSKNANNHAFKLNKPSNKAIVKRIIDLYPDLPHDDPMRIDSLRAITFDADGNLYVTNRARVSAELTAEKRAHVAIVPWGADRPIATIAMHADYHTIAGIRTNRMSRAACDALGGNCDVETLYVAMSSSGDVKEFLLDPDHYDGPDCASQGLGCARPVASFLGEQQGVVIDPRMLMVIHEAFVQ